MPTSQNNISIRVDIRHRLAQIKQRLWIHRMALLAALLPCWWLIGRLLQVDSNVTIGVSVVTTLLVLLTLPATQRYRQLNDKTFCQHLNRCFGAFEESAQLLLDTDPNRPTLQKLQRIRVAEVYRKHISETSEWLPAARLRAPLLVSLIAMLLLATEPDWRALLPTGIPTAADFVSALKSSDEPGQLTAATVQIVAPAYTRLPEGEFKQLDLELIEGSLVFWQLSFSNPDRQYELHFTDDVITPLLKSDNGLFEASSTLWKTGLYTIHELTDTGNRALDGIYTLTVHLDKVPRIRIVKPLSSSLEIARNAVPEFDSVALISDDFGIGNVSILASVAKGSGEGVKFRDQVFNFDQRQQTSSGIEYIRHWNLEALGMEPGDEVYFQVIALDNREPVPNTGRSGNVIVRWLNEEQLVMAAEGILIDLPLSYFKSQRQIIIDTEQLLEDQADITLDQFKQTAYGLGVDQAILKQKYGQYLGDEFGIGPGEQLSGGESSPGPVHQDDEHYEDSADADEFDASSAAGHEHDSQLSANSSGVSSNVTLEQLIDRFGHQHGEADIGPITQRNPVALMKRSVGFMWQAEGHLMQAEPAQALPYEYEAYKYLKMAQQADRIYTRRLGFEPPPVSEDRRLEGDLDEIRSYDTTSENRWSVENDQVLLRESFELLSTQRGSIIEDHQRQLLIGLGQRLTDWSQQRPALIRQAATVERLLLEGLIELPSCGECIDSLMARIWKLLAPTAATPEYGRRYYFTDDELVNSYLDASRATQPEGGPE